MSADAFDLSRKDIGRLLLLIPLIDPDDIDTSEGKALYYRCMSLKERCEADPSIPVTILLIMD